MHLYGSQIVCEIISMVTNPFQFDFSFQLKSTSEYEQFTDLN